jgi:hypothetical protein
MRRLIVLLLLLVFPSIACSFDFQMQPQSEIQTEAPGPSPVPATEVGIPGPGQTLAGPNIDYKGIRFILDPALGSRLYVYDEAITIDGATAHNTRFALNREEYCQTWCLMVYPVAEFEQAFGTFVFPPAGYRGGAGVIFKAQEMALSFQDGSGDRGLETFGQDHYGVSNESLKYVFRGYSVDKQYGIYVQVPAGAASLPDVAPTITTDAQDILEYNRRAAESMNGLTPADFTPNLGLLDALVASIHVETP